MTEKVSKSKTGQKEPVPSRKQRDAAFSSGGGREAVEVDKDAPKAEIQPPVGLDLETRGDEGWSESSSIEDESAASSAPAQRSGGRKASDTEDLPVDDGQDIEG